MIKKKIATAMMAVMMMAGSTVPAFAASTIEVSQEGYQINGTPGICPQNVKATYIDMGKYGNDRILVSFSAVKDAVSYEVKLTSTTSAAISKIYATKGTYLNIEAGNFAKRSSIKVQVRAVYADGTYSKWSNIAQTGCN